MRTRMTKKLQKCKLMLLGIPYSPKITSFHTELDRMWCGKFSGLRIVSLTSLPHGLQFKTQV